ncbi:hypothetical protein [Cellulomonas fimi]|uniref:Nuclear transport factor 2 family protein n=1 Tax=Cellulomonas fimi (strain ATCC 484 / DSM 20113 / JCM 1341 / CCUG 24087 / LMG 16345 / NBRC 15513 / NCIMB 8980 / NCTC 7547 / NRS-133) TaxID=590998 RepID=F4H0W9_CELFA|nr:hypothetical protein [Cellulomonas fimi]AEE46216.1 hypothetical protein Celf_2088 [Cellulomonas fimi ATCC 484]NNH08585.1 hypothetical protein [Cellulomonas fimi]VEH32096.1 Uncharacterised protein [Cellulomonas fimi]
MRTTTARGAALLLATLLVTPCAACAGTARTADARDVVRDFYDAVDAGDGARACALLTPGVVETVEEDEGVACAEALVDGDLADLLRSRAPATDAQVTRAGGEAQVRTALDTVFLTASGTSWLVSAASCDPRPPRPYDCDLEAA